MPTRQTKAGLGPLIREYFCERLINQQDVSPHTIASYRDTFRILLQFFSKQKHIPPSHLSLEHLEPVSILAFLDYLERVRKNSARTRNARLAALRSFLEFAGVKSPSNLAAIQRVLAIPTKRYRRPMIGHLSRSEIEALIEAPDSRTWSGCRDRMMILTMYNTGARVSEIIAMRPSDLSFGQTSTVKVHGKGRKERLVPLWKATSKRMREWVKALGKDSPLFPNRMGKALSRSGIENRLADATNVAAVRCQTLKGKHVTPHTIRHTTAMHLLQAGVDITIIALWLGHEGTQTTHQYVEADLEMKKKALSRVNEVKVGHVKSGTTEDVLRFLDQL